MADAPVRLSLVIPAYREADAIAATVARVREELTELADQGGLEVVVVDDGSHDGTADAARAAGADLVVELAENQGKGAAVRAGVLASHGATVAFTDADLSYAPVQVARLLAAAEAGAHVVIGNRFDAASTTLVEAGALRRLGGRGINLATRLVLRRRYDDTQCGLKAFRRPAADVLFRHAQIDGFAFDVELLHLAERYELEVVEVPVEVRNSDSSTVHVVRDALNLLVDLARVRRWSRHGRYDLAPAERSRLGADGAGAH